MNIDEVYQKLSTPGIKYALNVFGTNVVGRVFNPEELTDAVRYTRYTRNARIVEDGFTCPGRVTFPTVRILLEQIPALDAADFCKEVHRRMSEANAQLHSLAGQRAAMTTLRVMVEGCSFILSTIENSSTGRTVIIDLELGGG